MLSLGVVIQSSCPGPYLDRFLSGSTFLFLSVVAVDYTGKGHSKSPILELFPVNMWAKILPSSLSHLPRETCGLTVSLKWSPYK